jgi:hypothetical protein
MRPHGPHVPEHTSASQDAAGRDPPTICHLNACEVSASLQILPMADLPRLPLNLPNLNLDKVCLRACFLLCSDHVVITNTLCSSLQLVHRRFRTPPGGRRA